MPDESSAPKKPEGPRVRPVYPNPGQSFTGNKNLGEDIEVVFPPDAVLERPTRDDGDNDDLGDLAGGPPRYRRY